MTHTTDREIDAALEVDAAMIPVLAAYAEGWCAARQPNAILSDDFNNFIKHLSASAALQPKEGEG